MKAIARSLAVVLALALAAASQTPAAPPAPHRTIIRAGRLLDVKTGQMLTDQAIVIEGDKIVRVGGQFKAVAPGETYIDLSHATVLPGLIDAHTHITGDPWHHGYNELGISIAR